MTRFHPVRSRKLKAVMDIADAVGKFYLPASDMSRLVRKGLMKLNLDELLGLRIMIITAISGHSKNVKVSND